MTNNMRFGMWIVLQSDGRKWLCRCDCGVEREVIRWDLTSGRSTGCGCTRKERMLAAQAAAVTTHGLTSTPTYQTWVDMRRRCTDPDRQDYVNYGARGISVCPEWKDSFENFFADMGPRPEGHTIERKDNNGPYTKENCKWVPRAEQERNKRTNRFIEVDGRTMTVAEACEVYGFKPNTASNRLNTLGWSANDTFKRPLANRGQSAS